jgi:uncharacterized C2H2 Zn-finger protein
LTFRTDAECEAHQDRCGEVVGFFCPLCEDVFQTRQLGLDHFNVAHPRHYLRPTGDDNYVVV